MSKSRPKTIPKSGRVVVGPQVWCEVICDRVLNHMLFHWISIHAESLHMIKYNKSMVVRFRNAMVPRFCVWPTFKRWFLKKFK